MLSQTIQNALNDQVRNEIYSAHLYLAMAAYFEDSNWPGFAQWMRVQSREETAHATKFFEYIIRRNGRAIIQAIEQPPADFTSALDAFQQALAHEQEVTRLITALYSLAAKGNDTPTQIELQWFVNEQVEEERNAALIVEQLKRVGDHSNALFMLDHQLGKRGTTSS
ncbi:MAG TPA: ferritin [Anaerolineae bacterium]